jgi:hypothetical protein
MDNDTATRYQELALSDYDRDELNAEVLSRNHPLGNDVFEYTNDHFNPQLYQLLFNFHPSHFQEDEGVRPAIILGRRGSGKSSYLNNLAHKEHIAAIPVNSWDIVDLIERQVSVILQSQESIDPEKVADIWHLVFLTLIARHIGSMDATRQSVRSLLANFPVRNIVSKSIEVVSTEVLDWLRTKHAENSNHVFNVNTIFYALNLGENSLSGFETALHKIARDCGKCIVLMIDNPEQLHQDFHEKWESSYVDSNKARWKTYAGLLTLLSTFNEGKIALQARYCVPAEQYFFLRERSTAILKHLSKIQVLHWTSGEILSALAHRYMVYLQLHRGNRSGTRYQNLKKVEIYTRDGAFEFFRKVFEPKIKNSRGYEEDAITYLLRHTQLLPRQIIIYLNEAIHLALCEDPGYDLTQLESRFIKQAIHNKEGLLAVEVVDSYASVFPEGSDMMRAVAKLPVLTTVGDIKTRWAEYGAKKVLSKYSSFPEVVVEADRFIRFLTEVGIIGRASLQTEPEAGSYASAAFEYTMPERLMFRDEDAVAVHPLFCSHCDQQQCAELDPYRAVYPKGTEPDDIDKRPLMRKFVPIS